MAQPSSDYHRGEMDIQEQASTYSVVMLMTKWGSLALAVSVLFLTLWFCTQTGFIGSAISALVLLVAGIALLREKTPAH